MTSPTKETVPCKHDRIPAGAAALAIGGVLALVLAVVLIVAMFKGWDAALNRSDNCPEVIHG